MSRPRDFVLAVAVAAAALACDGAPEPDAAPRWPAGTVLAVGDLAISSTEVDRATVFVERIEPQASPAQLRRLALANVVFPNALARSLAPEPRAAAAREAQAAFAALATGATPERPEPARIVGGWLDLGIETWGVAMDLPDGEWSEPIEEGGRFALVRRVRREEAELPIATRVEVDLLLFPYLDPSTAAAEIEAAYDRFRLTIVDPSWREIVPELTQHRMKARQP